MTDSGRSPNANADLIAWIAEACRTAREIAKVSQADVGRFAGLARSGINRFEGGRAWPKDPARIVKSYAMLCGFDDSRDLWRIALLMWTQYGSDAPAPVGAGEKPDLSSHLVEFLERKHAAAAKAGPKKPSRRRSAA